MSPATQAAFDAAGTMASDSETPRHVRDACLILRADLLLDRTPDAEIVGIIQKWMNPAQNRWGR